MRQDRLARWIAALVIILLVIGPLFSSGIGLLVDWLWFGHESFRNLYTTPLKAQVALSAYFGIGFIVIVGCNLWIARALARRSGFHVYSQVVEFPGLDRLNTMFRSFIWLGVLLIGYFVGDWAATHWMDYLLAAHPVPMPQSDPLFGINVGFYLFRLPFLWFLYHFCLAVLIVCLLSAAFLYFVEGGVSVGPRGASIARQPRAHLMVVGGLFFVLFAWRARLGMYDLLYSSRGLIYGAGYTDVHATLPVLWILLVLCCVTAIGFFIGARLGRLAPALWTIGALIGVAILGGAVYPAIIQQYIVTPNELAKEEDYIGKAIEFTRQAYALDRFEERSFPAVQDLTLDSIHQNQATMNNVRLWDHVPLLSTFQQLQEIRTYYDFTHISNDRYRINSDYRQVSLSARELSSDSLPDPNWVNQHLIYTHGYGLCMGPVNESTPDGLPVLFIKNIPPDSSIPLNVTRPEIYYGQLPNDYCIVKTTAREFDYPSGQHDVYNTYDGSGGVSIGNIWRRLLFTLRFGQINILLSGYIQPASRIMIYRRVLDRVNRLTPFISYDSSPYLVISKDGSLYWMLDGYTVSDQYPYSEPTDTTNGSINYIRNAVKVTVNAYDGRVRFYISDPTDPLIQAYARIFPGVFQPLSQMPADLRAHIRYPQDFFAIQASKYSVYHMTDPRVFYSKEDLWRVANQSVGGEVQPMAPYYTIMKLPEAGTTEEFVLMVPFTPARKNNMIAWMAARCDGTNYGKVLVFMFSKDKLIYGPQQIESRINQNPEISQQLTLWDQGGSKVIQGTLLVVPVANAVLYVEPLYLAAQSGGALPELKRVIVAYSDHVVMNETFAGALGEIFGGGAEAATSSPETAPAAPSSAGKAGIAGMAPARFRSLIGQANQYYQQAQKDLRHGNWSGYGQDVLKLGGLLKQLQAK
ncbi:MAG: UPF0182 family protein [Terriglobia bacterium]